MEPPSLSSPSFLGSFDTVVLGTELVLENVALRQQLNYLAHKTARPRLTSKIGHSELR